MRTIRERRALTIKLVLDDIVEYLKKEENQMVIVGC